MRKPKATSKPTGTNKAAYLSLPSDIANNAAAIIPPSIDSHIRISSPVVSSTILRSAGILSDVVEWEFKNPPGSGSTAEVELRLRRIVPDGDGRSENGQRFGKTSSRSSGTFTRYFIGKRQTYTDANKQHRLCHGLVPPTKTATAIIFFGAVSTIATRSFAGAFAPYLPGSCRIYCRARETPAGRSDPD